MILLPKHFTASGLHCGIKTSGKLDLSLFVSQVPADVAAVFTSNKMYAAPISVSREHLSSNKSKARAIIVSSGNANAATGEEGKNIALGMCSSAASTLDCASTEILIAQTGLIGVPLNYDTCIQGVKKAALSVSEGGGLDAATGMMTTDTKPKWASTFLSDGSAIVGLGKGVAMAYPSMATMIVVLLTDCFVNPAFLRYSLKRAVDDSFHVLSIDGCQSTNDTVFIMANGAAKQARLDFNVGELSNEFIGRLTDVCKDLAMQMASDAEGGTKLLVCKVKGAVTSEEARKAARQVVNSTLVKCAIAGESPYWGRVIAEIGASQVTINPDTIDISFGDIRVCHKGSVDRYDDQKVHEYMKGPSIIIDVDLNLGSAVGTAYGSDLTPEYVRINMEKS